MKVTILAVALLVGAMTAGAEDDKDCTKDIAVGAERSGILARANRFVGSSENQPAARAFLANATLLWACPKDSASHCCKKIPVDVWIDADACFVTLPYGKLNISTDSGTKKPRVVWQLRVERSADQLFKHGFAFDQVAGIRLLKVPGKPLPVKDGDHETKGNGQRFKLDSTGILKSEAGHEPRVFPRKGDGSLDLANECTPWDPTITNTN